MLVSYDGNNCRYLTETEDFPQNDEGITEFLRNVEDDSSWKCIENVKNLEKLLNIDNRIEDCPKILAEIEKEL